MTASTFEKGNVRASTVLQFDELSKTFPGGHRALKDVHLDLRAGEIHGLLGQNGSGKSTLIKILAGVHAPDSGSRLQIGGAVVQMPLDPSQLHQLGLLFVHQHLGLADELTVLENLRVGRYMAGPLSKIKWRQEEQRAAEALSRFGISLDPGTLVSTLSESQRAILAIARALQEVDDLESAVLVLDEPTAYLSGDALEVLFGAMRQVAQSGVTILFVTHRLEEVLALTDRVTVLRDGAVVGTARTVDLDEGQLVEMIIGKRMTDFYPSPHVPGHGLMMKLNNATARSSEPVSFELQRGEVLGLTGLIGSGFEHVPYLIMGSEPATDGELEIEGSTARLKSLSVRERIDMGITLVPGNRARDGGVGSLTVLENMTLPRISTYFRHLLLDQRAQRVDVSALLEEFEVRPREPDKLFGTLSGGNQQKVVVAKWLATTPKVLLLHEPTQGVDVEARKEIFQQIRNAAERGCSVVYASLEYDDLAHLCDRVLVFRNGRIVTELVGEGLAADRIVAQCYLGETEAKPTQPAIT